MLPEVTGFANDILKDLYSNSDREDFVVLKGTDVHPFMISGDAYVNTFNGHIVFLDQTSEKVKRFLYYIGAENCNLIAALDECCFDTSIYIYDLDDQLEIVEKFLSKSGE